jgi:small subunit ribosomal protein S1
MLSTVILLSAGLSANAFHGLGVFSTCRRGSSEVLMSTATLTGKNIQLNTVKQRYSGRGDLGAPDADTDIDTYSLFAEADADEMDPPKTGNIITGTVIEMDDNGALLEIGGKMSGYLPVKEAALIPIKHVNSVLTIGQEVTAEVVGTLKGMPVMSLRSAQLGVAWEKILEMRSADTSFESEVIEVNKGGAVLSVFGLKAFLPGSHYLGSPDSSLIGTTLKVKFLDLNEEEGKIVVSQRRAMMESQSMDLKRGEVVSGTITGIRPYGAFLELDGGVAGLLHISQISYDRIDNLENLFNVGQRAKVMILDHDKLNGRVALSTKTLEPSPGDMLRNMEAVFAQAEETAGKYHERMEAERKAREAAAKDIVAGLGGSLEGESGGDPLMAVAESIESILASIVSDSPEDKSA